MEPVTPKPAKKVISLGECIAFTIVQQAFMLIVGAGMLDGGAIFQIVSYAAVAYWVCFALIMIRRSRTLTPTDKILIRWGYLILAFVVSPSITRMLWSLRGF